MKYILLFLIVIFLSICGILLFKREMSFESVKDFVSIENIHIFKEADKLHANVKFINQSEYDIELDQRSYTGVERIVVASLEIGNKCYAMSEYNNPIFIPAKSSVIEKFTEDLNIKSYSDLDNSDLDNKVILSYPIQAWKYNKKPHSAHGKVISFEYTADCNMKCDRQEK